MSEPRFTDEQLAGYKQKLLDEKTKIEADRAYYQEQDRDQPMSQETETSDYDPNDPADEASDLFDRERNMAEIDNMNRLIAKIDRALQKIEEGTYGLSDIDSTPIPTDRLDAIPYAVTTVDQVDTY